MKRRHVAVTAGAGALVASMVFSGAAWAAGTNDEAISANAANSEADAVVDAVDALPAGVKRETVNEEVSPANIPADPNAPVTLEGTPVSLTAGMDGSTVSAESKGMTVHSGTESATSTVIQPTAKGVRFMSVIEGPDSPERFEFNVGHPEDFKMERLPTGALVVLDAANQAALTIDAPWARDAAGRDIPTHFEVDGATVTQVVEHRGLDLAYPVVADPNAYTDKEMQSGTSGDGRYWILRRGYYDADANAGFGWDKIFWKHNITQVSVVRTVISRSYGIADGATTRVYELRSDRILCTRRLGPWCLNARYTGEWTVVRAIVNYRDDPKIGGHNKQKGVITAYCKGVIRCPDWVSRPGN